MCYNSLNLGTSEKTQYIHPTIKDVTVEDEWIMDHTTIKCLLLLIYY